LERKKNINERRLAMQATQGCPVNLGKLQIFVGLDVHLKSWSVTIATLEMIIKTFTQPPSPEILAQYLHRHFPGATFLCGYEAGFCGFWIRTCLQALGIPCIVFNPADVPTTQKEKYNKTDRIDSRKIAESLRNHKLSAIYVPSPEQLEDRTLVRLREKTIRKQTRSKNQIKGLLHFYGISLPEDICERYWSRRFLLWLKQLELTSTSGTFSLQMLLADLEHQRQTLCQITKQIRVLANTVRYRNRVELVASIDGIGTISAMIFLTELVDIRRFPDLDHLAAYVGLVPTEHSTGDTHHVGPLTPRKNSWLRFVLIEAAWTAVRKDPELLIAFQRLSQRMKKTVAIIHIARKLLSRIRFVLIHQTSCRSLSAA
jgi:transposase